MPRGEERQGAHAAPTCTQGAQIFLRSVPDRRDDADAADRNAHGGYFVRFFSTKSANVSIE